MNPTINRFIFTNTANVIKCCKILFSNTEVKGFIYARQYRDTRLALLTTYSEFTTALFRDSEQLFLKTINNYMAQQDQDFVIISPEKISPSIAMTCHDYRIDTMLILLIKNHTKLEYFIFFHEIGTAISPQAYLNQINFYQQFSLYFKSKAGSLMRSAKLNKQCTVLASKPVKNTSQEVGTEDIAKGLSVNFDNDPIFTEKEIECACHLLLGKTAYEISVVMNISKRTVEKHIENMKDKVGVEKKSSLIAALYSMNFPQSFLQNYIT